MHKPLFALLVFGSLAACGDGPQAPRDVPDGVPHDAPPASEAQEAQIQREADAARRSFLGEGKAKYTPQRVDGF